MQNTVLTSALV